MRNCASALAVALLLATSGARTPLLAAAAQEAVTQAALSPRPPGDAAPDLRAAYTAITRREALLRRDLDAPSGPASPALAPRMRAVVAEYRRLAEGDGGPFTDDAFWQGATLAADTYWAFGEEPDRQSALRLYTGLRRRFPTSPLTRQATSAVARLEAAGRLAATSPHAPGSRVTATAGPASSMSSLAASPPTSTLTTIRREALPDTLRVVLELERETTFRDERLDGPPRVFVDLRHTRTVAALRDAALTFPDDVVRQVRVGRPDGDTTRVVFDLQEAGRYSVYPLYEPYRLVIDFERAPGAARRRLASATQPPAAVSAVPATPAPLKPGPSGQPPGRMTPSPAARPAQPAPTVARPNPPATLRAASTGTTGSPQRGPAVTTPSRATPGAAWALEPLPANPVAVTPVPMVVMTAPPSGSKPDSPVALPEPPPASTLSAVRPPPVTPAPPAAPTPNGRGGFSLSRQLGLGVSRVVIDAGHGGHDPGARVKGLNEADVVLDIALRLEKLLAARGIDVVLTRRGNVYVPLEQRTALANREGADLFLSIHANASDNPKARGIETYFLNFAANPEAERVAARENASAGRTMHSLPDIVRAIALNNKINESRDFAGFVQASMLERLRGSNREARDLGVKQAPFMVLIGAAMPSILAEISFITNRDEASLLKTTGYRQQVAESLLAGILKYQRALKTSPSQTVAAQ